MESSIFVEKVGLLVQFWILRCAFRYPFPVFFYGVSPMLFPAKVFTICILLLLPTNFQESRAMLPHRGNHDFTGWKVSIAPARAIEDVSLYLMEVKPYTIDSPEKKGIVGDVVLEAMRRAGYRAKIIVMPVPRALLLVPNMQNALIVPLARLEEREANFTWIARVINSERTFFTLGGKVNSFAEANANFKSIGVTRGSAGFQILLHQGFEISKLKQVNQGVTAAKMLNAGRFDAWYSSIHEEQQLEKDAAVRPFVMSVPLGKTEEYLGCSKRCDQTMVDRLSETIVEMQKDGSVKKIIAAYGL